jgi:hypothetical protein
LGDWGGDDEESALEEEWNGWGKEGRLGSVSLLRGKWGRRGDKEDEEEEEDRKERGRRMVKGGGTERTGETMTKEERSAARGCGECAVWNGEIDHSGSVVLSVGGKMNEKGKRVEICVRR